MVSQAQPGQFAGDHPGVRGHPLVGGGPLDQFGVAEGHGDRGAQLVRGILQELALLLQQAQVLLGDPLHLFHGRQPFLGGGQPSAAVPHHDQEHQRDQRNFGQVVGVLLALEDLHEDDAAGGQRHGGQGQDGGLDAPQPEPVDHGQADPDGQERHRLPGRDQAHGGQVEADEHGPGDIRGRRPDPLQVAQQRRHEVNAVGGGGRRGHGSLDLAILILRPHDLLRCFRREHTGSDPGLVGYILG